MKIIITGATGFLGKALVQALLTRGDEVIALTRNGDKGRRTLGSQVEVHEWHPPEIGPWAEAFNGAGGIVNLSGEPILNRPWTKEQKERLVSSRVDPTRAVLEAIKAASPRPGVLVNQSAIGYYGSAGAAILTEESPPGNDFPAFVVQEWEAAARPVGQLGVRLVILRTGIVLGKGGGALTPMVLPFRLFGGGTMGQPGQWFSWIHLDDWVGLVIRALTHQDMHGVWNATAPNPVTMDQFSREIGQAIGRPTWVPFYGTMMRVALGPERGKAALVSQRVLPRAAEAAGYTFAHPQSGETLRSILLE